MHMGGYLFISFLFFFALFWGDTQAILKAFSGSEFRNDSERCSKDHIKCHKSNTGWLCASKCPSHYTFSV